MPRSRRAQASAPETESYARLVGDFRRSLTLAPVSVVLGLATYAIVYPLVVRDFGYETIGIWGLLTAVSTALAAADIGFSLQVQRDTSTSMHEDERIAMRGDIAASRGLYTVLWLVAIAMAIVALPLFRNRAGTIYPSDGLLFSIIVVLTSAWVTLLANLDRAVLIGLRDAPFTYAAAISTPVITLAIALLGVLRGRPIEGLACATLTSALILLGLFRLRLVRRHESWLSIAPPPHSVLNLRRAMRFAIRGSGFYVGTIGMLVRQPVVRFATAGVAGLAGVASIDIAFRVTNAARGLATAGAAPMLNSYAVLSREHDAVGALRFTQDSLATILNRGALPVATVAALAPLVPIWLGQPNPEMIGTIKVVAMWGLLTLFNVPFWYCLQANHEEKFAAASVWIHTLSLLAILPMSRTVDASAITVACYWFASAVLTQAAILARVDRRFMPLSSVFGSWRVKSSTILALATAMIALAVSVVLAPTDFSAAAPLLGSWVLWSTVYLGLVVFILPRRTDRPTSPLREEPDPQCPPRH